MLAENNEIMKYAALFVCVCVWETKHIFQRFKNCSMNVYCFHIQVNLRNTKTVKQKLKLTCKFTGMDLGQMDLMIRLILVGVMTQKVA